MLTADYFTKVYTADDKSVGPYYRRRTAEELIESYDHANHDIVERSRILFDAARLLGFHHNKKFTEISTINAINTEQKLSENQNPDMEQLLTDTSIRINDFKKNLFTHFADFKRNWSEREFETADTYLEKFYRDIPYIKLEIDEEQEVKSLTSTEKKNALTLGFARQRAVIRRINEVFLPNAPADLPEAIRESLIDYAVRTGEDSIPLSAVDQPKATK